MRQRQASPNSLKLCRFSIIDFNDNFPNNEAYLKDYEAKIRKLPLDELYEVLEQIEDHPLYKDRTPERINIVKKRIRELEPGAALEKAEKEALHAKVVEECEKNDDPRIGLFSILSMILLILAIAYLGVEKSNFFLESLLIGGAGILHTISCIFKKKAAIRGCVFYKDKNPQGFKFVISNRIALGALVIIFAILQLCGILK